MMEVSSCSFWRLVESSVIFQLGWGRGMVVLEGLWSGVVLGEREPGVGHLWVGIV